MKQVIQRAKYTELPAELLLIKSEVKVRAVDKNDYPDSWKNLRKTEREKAIEIGNALLKDGYSESRAIPIATSKAEEWYKNHKES